MDRGEKTWLDLLGAGCVCVWGGREGGDKEGNRPRRTNTCEHVGMWWGEKLCTEKEADRTWQ